MTDLAPTPPQPTTVIEVRVVAGNAEYTWVGHGLGTTEAEALASLTLPEGYTLESHEITRTGLDPDEFELTKGRYPKELVV